MLVILLFLLGGSGLGLGSGRTIAVALLVVPGEVLPGGVAVSLLLLPVGGGGPWGSTGRVAVALVAISVSSYGNSMSTMALVTISV